jgi:hypothetical protein
VRPFNCQGSPLVSPSIVLSFVDLRSTQFLAEPVHPRWGESKQKNIDLDPRLPPTLRLRQTGRGDSMDPRLRGDRAFSKGKTPKKTLYFFSAETGRINVHSDWSHPIRMASGPEALSEPVVLGKLHET